MSARSRRRRSRKSTGGDDLLETNTELRDELAQLKALVDGLPIGIYVLDPDGKSLLTNTALEELISPASDRSLPILYPHPQSDTTGFYESLVEAASAAEVSTRGLEGKVAAADGQATWIRERLRAVLAADGSVKRYEGTVQDIADQHRVQEALRTSEERYRSVVEHSPAGILLVDDKTRIVFANRETSRILGLEQEQVIGHSFVEFLHPESREVVLRRYQARQRGESVPNRYEVKVLSADGTVRDIVLSATTYRNDAGLARTAAQILDITDRAKAEQALRDYTEALELRNSELDAFADSVAHDLKNPLSTIIGFAEALLDQLDVLEPDEIIRVLRSISTMGRKMDGIIDELLIFSRIRRTAVQPSPVDMGPVVDSALMRLQRAIAETQAEVRLPRAWPQALGHGPWIEEVWANYISNAIAYGGKPPQIELGADLLPEGRIRFWVRDNGDGLSPAVQARIFDGISERSLSRGHGLGLSIVKRIVNKLGGEVAVRSSGMPGEGSVFSFILPAALTAGELKTG